MSENQPYPILGGQFFKVSGGTFSLNDLSVPGSREWVDDEYWECVYMRPGIEWIRVFKKDVLIDDETYVYISENYLVQIFQEEVAEPDVSDYAWAIGWWKSRDTDYRALIEAHNDELQVKEPVTIKAGTGFIGEFATDHDLIFNFPSALELPTQAK